MNTGHPSTAYFISDALHRLRRPLVPSLVAVLILFAATTAIFATTGLAVASQQRTLERINSPEGRLITVTDAQGSAGLSADSVLAVRSLTGVDWVLGVGAATDVTNPNISGGTKVQARRLFGQLPPPIAPDTGNSLQPGQALAGPGLPALLGMGDGVGPVSSRTLDAVVVGGFIAGAPLGSLNENLLIAAPPGQDPGQLVTLWVSVGDVAQLGALTEAVTNSLVVKNPGSVKVTTSTELALLGADVAAEMASSARLTITGLLFAVSLLVGAVQFGRVSTMARDIGRSRALGATRSTIVVQILINAGICGLVGAGLGIGAGLAINLLVAGALPGASFTLGVAALMVLAALAGSVLPALRAARMDPVRILRVP